MTCTTWLPQALALPKAREKLSAAKAASGADRHSSTRGPVQLQIDCWNVLDAWTCIWCQVSGAQDHGNNLQDNQQQHAIQGSSLRTAAWVLHSLHAAP